MEIPGWLRIVQVSLTATVGICLLAAAVQGYFFGRINIVLRVILLVGALCMIEGGGLTDLIGLGIGVAIFFYQRAFVRGRQTAAAE